jgi:chemotaxis protein MotC
MGMAARSITLALVVLTGVFCVRPASAAGTEEELAPYKLLRSLQFIQDSVVLGDHSAVEMQRFMLKTVDKRLREASSDVFEDPHNVDAALIYAMSGGNPDTLEYLVARDVDGNFDSRVANVLRQYLRGKGLLVQKDIAGMMPEYRDTTIGPYLALVAGNVTQTKDPAKALEFYAWARLKAPGTIVEEAALRRSILISMDAGFVHRAMRYARQYSRRFLHSPYASQFADLFVTLAVDYNGEVTEDEINMILEPMDKDRQREVFLRIARRAAISGRDDLAKSAAEKVKQLSDGPGNPEDHLADLYSGFASIPTDGVESALSTILETPNAVLTSRDKALKDAAAYVAKEVTRPPDPALLEEKADPQKPFANPIDGASPGSPDSLAQGNPSTDHPQDEGAAASDVPQAPAQDGAMTASAEGGADQASPDRQENDNLDPSIKGFLTSGQSKLDEIDKMLDKESILP